MRLSVRRKPERRSLWQVDMSHKVVKEIQKNPPGSEGEVDKKKKGKEQGKKNRPVSASVLGSWGNTMRGAVGNKES